MNCKVVDMLYKKYFDYDMHSKSHSEQIEKKNGIFKELYNLCVESLSQTSKKSHNKSRKKSPIALEDHDDYYNLLNFGGSAGGIENEERSLKYTKEKKSKVKTHNNSIMQKTFKSAK